MRARVDREKPEKNVCWVIDLSKELQIVSQLQGSLLWIFSFNLPQFLGKEADLFKGKHGSCNLWRISNSCKVIARHAFTYSWVTEEVYLSCEILFGYNIAAAWSLKFDFCRHNFFRSILRLWNVISYHHNENNIKKSFGRFMRIARTKFEDVYDRSSVTTEEALYHTGFWLILASFWVIYWKTTKFSRAKNFILSILFEAFVKNLVIFSWEFARSCQLRQIPLSGKIMFAIRDELRFKLSVAC